MNLKIDTLEIRSLSLPFVTPFISALLTVALVAFILSSLMRLYERCNAAPEATRATQHYVSASCSDHRLEEAL